MTPIDVRTRRLAHEEQRSSTRSSSRRCVSLGPDHVMIHDNRMLADTYATVHEPMTPPVGSPISQRITEGRR